MAWARALQQLVTGFSSASGADVAVFDLATDSLERVIHDYRATGPGRFGYNQTMFLDEAGDLYVYCIASYGFEPGQSPGSCASGPARTSSIHPTLWT
jgi:hypothetical protein